MDCHLLSHGISIEKESVHDCCLMRGESHGRPYIIDIVNNSVDWEELFLRKKHLKNSKAENECKGCLALKDKDYDDRNYISYINFNHWNVCNSKCIYCGSEYNGGDKYFNILPIIKSLIDKNYFQNDGEITFQGGEPTILPEFEDLLELFLKEKARIRVHSSGIKFSEAIHSALSENLITVVISPDCGKSETYKIIKRVNCFEKVWENIGKYAEAQKSSDKVKIKYIIIPGVNDDISEVDEWFKKCTESKINNIIIEVEGAFASKNEYCVPQACMLIDYMVYKAEKLGLNYEFYDNAFYSVEKRTESKTSQNLLQNRELFEKEYNLLREKYKYQNMNYN